MEILTTRSIINARGFVVAIVEEQVEGETRFCLDFVPDDGDYCFPDRQFGDYKTLSAAKRACYRRFGISRTAWKDAKATSKAVKRLQKFCEQTGATMHFSVEFCEQLLIMNDIAIVSTDIEYAGKMFRLNAGEQRICATVDVSSNLYCDAHPFSTISVDSIYYDGPDEDKESHMDLPHDPAGDNNFRLWGLQQIQGKLSRWTGSTDAVTILNAIGLQGRETIHIEWTKANFAFDCERDISRALEQFVQLLETIPPYARPVAPPGGFEADGLIMDPSKVPEVLQPLVPLTKKWSIGDDVRRCEAFENASARMKKKLIDTMDPLYDEMNKYLDSFSPDPTPDEALLIMSLAEGVAEMDRDDSS